MTRSRRHGGPPPWWPEGERWAPGEHWGHGERPWGHGERPWGGRVPRHARRRFRARLFTLIALVCLFGWTLGRLMGDDWQDRGNKGGRPFSLFGLVVGVLIVGAIASARAYRRLGRPIGRLLDAADQVAEGDFAIAVRPEGPRELRSLAAAFNEMAGRLAVTDEQRRRFLADVSHELRTPLAVLQSGLEAQLDGIHPRDDQHLASLLDETKRLGRLVGDLHTLALADAGKLVLHREAVDAGQLVAEAVAAHLPLAERNEVMLLVDAPAGLPAVDVDGSRIRQVLDNLLSNAVRHTPAGEEVRVELAASGDGSEVSVTVSDAGPGFSADQLAHVFDRFVRAADAQGSGLGLSIARDLVQAHGGTITARNRPTTGAAVTFTLPAAG